MKNPRLFYFAIVGALIVAASTVFAGSREGSHSERVLAFREAATGGSLIGSLVCQMPERNDGSPCEIRVQEDGTGVVFRLENSASARRLFNDGVRKVTLTGARTSDTLFTITGASAR